MIASSTSVDKFIEELPENRRESMLKLRESIRKNLPEGFEETLASEMISYVVPLSKYAKGYHASPQTPLPFISVASQKNFIAVYHMGLYADPKLLEWFVEEFKKQVRTKLDMGKSCVRFKKPEHIPFELIAKLAARISPDEWIYLYEREIKKSK
jgi:uncharacterized protein YdhG (YjbR/CyaY superfamily)